MASQRFQLGLLTPLRDNPTATIQKVRAVGLSSCQVWCRVPDALTDANLKGLASASRTLGVEMTALWVKPPGPAEYNLIDGPRTIGLVPGRWRRARIRALIVAADAAAKLGVPMISAHAGFIPEDPRDPRYGKFIEAAGEVVAHCRRRGVAFCFETGQETPHALLRCIEDLGQKNVGVNLDAANLVAYGKANPIDAVALLGKHVCGVHAKDATLPPNGREFGRETIIGRGRVDFRALFAALKRAGYRGAITIERETTGAEQERDIRNSIRYLSPLL